MAGFGGSVKLTGESEYRRALKQISENLTVLSSEMKVVNSLYDKNDTSTDKLTKKNEVLTKRLEEQNKSLSEAKKMLDQAKNSTEANATTIAKWQNEVNKAQAEVNKTTKELKDNTEQIKKNEEALDNVNDELEEFKKNEDGAGQSAIKLGDLIKANVVSEFIISGVKALGSAMMDIAKKAVDLGKQALQSYAEYEQLIGGVETLFKDSSGTVENYANNAYKTAGLSANEYMETVTSFSASLLDSLDGDTAKSAEIADMAITDMADNANKMGTSIDMIQNAYQGFAKQNYTMLDNLKLGYGGTKSEMERLLRDAEQMPEALGQKFDLNNYADVVKAINVVQQNMGIAGTTSKEAGDTISGSLASMKSAWSNLLTGVADENADFGLLINNFVESILTVGDNLLPRIQTIIQGMGELVSGLLTQLIPEIVNIIPPLIEETLPTLITALQTALTSILAVFPQVAEAIGEMIPMFLTAVVELLPMVSQSAIGIVVALAQGIAKSLPTLIPTVVDALLVIVDNLIDNIDLIIDAGIELIMGLADGLIEALPRLIEKIPTIITNLLDTVSSNLPKLIGAGIELIVKLAVGMVQAIPELVAAIPKIMKGVIDALGNYYKELWNVGVNLLKGLWDGISSWAVDLWQKIKDLGNSIVNWFKDIFGINSPSKVFADEIGKNMALGVGAGFEDTMSGVTDQMTNAIPTNFETSINATTGSVTSTNTFANMVDAFKEALKEVNIVLDDEVAGRFVTDTVERAVYN